MIRYYLCRERYKTVRAQSAMNASFSRRFGFIAIALSWSLALFWVTATLRSVLGWVIALSWFLALVWVLPLAADPSTAAVDAATQACSVNWRDRGRYVYPAAYLLLGLVTPLSVEAAIYYGVYVGVMRTSRRLHQRAVVSGRGSIVNLAMRVSQSSSRWSVVSCQSRSSTSTASRGRVSVRASESESEVQSRSSTSSSGPMSSVSNLLMVSYSASTHNSITINVSLSPDFQMIFCYFIL